MSIFIFAPALIAAVAVGVMMGRASARIIVREPLILPPEPSHAQVSAALGSLLRGMWTGSAGQIGLDVPRSSWRGRMEDALSAAAAVKSEDS